MRYSFYPGGRHLLFLLRHAVAEHIMAAPDYT
jgi:hypothetical protein